MQHLRLPTLLVAWAASPSRTAAWPAPGSQSPWPALVVDDECLAADGVDGQCALHALQRRGLGVTSPAPKAAVGQPPAVDSQEEGDDDQAFIAGCSNATGARPCPGAQRCVSKPDGTWSQCVDCSRRGFERDCILMNGEMRRAASAVCGRQCHSTTPRPILSGCDDEVPGRECPEDLTCVATADGTWSQCIDCSRRFYQDCQKLNHDLRHAAVRKCRRTCMDAQCDDASWCWRPYRCIGDGAWAQCLRCDRATFKYRCHRWGEDLKRAAERQCHQRCRSPGR